MKLEPNFLAELYRVAEQATAGPWFVRREFVTGNYYYEIDSIKTTFVCKTTEAELFSDEGLRNKRNSEFIAMASPEIVMALIDEIRKK